MINEIKSSLQKPSEVWLHILLWTFMIAERWVNHYSVHEDVLTYGTYQTLIFVSTFMAPVYLNATILIPTFFRKSKWLKYSLLLIGMLLLCNVIRGLLTILYFAYSGYEFEAATEFIRWSGLATYLSFDSLIFSPTSWIVYTSFAYRLIKDWITHERVTSALRAENLNMELAFLKSQIDPHFLFNTLNSLYAVALEEKATRTADGVAKMGTLMRYTLHDAQTDFIPLNKEVDYIKKYIEIQQVRLAGDMRGVTATFEVDPDTTLQIAPMLILPFVENAFKYGVSSSRQVRIGILLRLEHNKLLLMVSNLINHKPSSEGGGLGTSNVENRLRLLYPGRHELRSGIENNMYSVDLEITLHP